MLGVKQPTVFWGNKRVTHEAIIARTREDTLMKLVGLERVLITQDTTSFNFSHHPSTEGLGMLENAYTMGFLAHNSLAVSLDGIPLGLLDQQAWARDDRERGKSAQRHTRAFEEKESYKWVGGLPEVAELPAGVQPIVVCDAESHIYEFLVELKTRSLDYILRAADHRSFTPDGQTLFKAIAEQPVQECFSIDLKRRPDRAARTAQLELRFDTITLRQPQRVETDYSTLTLYVVDVQEIDAPEGEKPIHWVLLTSLPVTTIAEAQQIVTWYSYRWLIERFHFVLKSGCKMEDSQLRSEDRLERLLAVYSIVAWRLLRLTYQARITPDVPCTAVLSEVEWQALYLFTQRSKRLPKQPPTLRQAVRWIAQLGGFLGRRGDGEPGVKVLWRGWTRLQDIVETYTLLQSPQRCG